MIHHNKSYVNVASLSLEISYCTALALLLVMVGRHFPYVTRGSTVGDVGAVT